MNWSNAPRGWWAIPLMAVIAAAAYGSNSKLADAAQNRDKQAIRSLLKQRANVNLPQPDGATALAWAAHWDDLETADLLIAAGANANTANEYGVTPLLLACTNGSAAMAAKLLNAGANPNYASPAGVTPLLAAANTGSAGVVKLLLEHGANINAKEARGGQTALMWAVVEKHPEVVKVLIEHSADIRARSSVIGFTPLLFAAQIGDIASAELLLAAGADANERSTSFPPTRVLPSATLNNPLEYDPYLRKRTDRVELLAPEPEQERPAGPDGMTPLLLATATGHEDFAIFLLDHGADVNLADRSGTALHYALRKGLSYIYRLDYNGGADDPSTRAPNLEKLVKALIARGANPNAPLLSQPPAMRLTTSETLVSPMGATPLLLAAAAADPALLRFLLDHGASPVQATKDLTTPLMVAAGLGRGDVWPQADERAALECVKILVEQKADVNAANVDGATALHGAARTGANSIIEYLAGKGAKLDAMDKLGQTPLSIAQGVVTKKTLDFQKGPSGPHADTAELLLKLGATPLEASGVEVMDVLNSGQPVSVVR